MAALFVLGAVAPGRADVGPAGSGGTTTTVTTVTKLSQEEIIRRKELIFRAMKAIEEGEKFEQEGELMKARERYAFAIQNLGYSPATAGPGNRARAALVRVNFKLYEQAKKDGDTPLALTVLEEITIIEPENKEAKRLLVVIKETMKDPPDTAVLGNPAVTPSFVKKVREVEKLFIEAAQYEETGQYDIAEIKLNNILKIDPYNETAAEQLEHLMRLKQIYADTAREYTRQKRLTEVEQDWNNPPKADVYDTLKIGDDEGFTRSPSFATDQKLRSLIIPDLTFNNASIEDAAIFFSSQSKQLDPTGQGISFIVKPEAASSARRFSLRLRNVPMDAALRYVTQLAQVKYKPEEFAVVIIPLTQSDVVLLNRTFRVQPDFFFAGAPGATGETTAAATRGRRPPPVVRDAAAGAAPADGGDAKSVLESRGVVFPPGATAVYSRETGILQVRNTQDQLDLIQELIDAGQTPVFMVDVKAKFIEISQEDLNELTFNTGYNLLPSLDAVGNFLNWDNWLPFNTEFGDNNGTPNGFSGSTALRGSQGFTVSSLDALVRGSGAPRPNLFAIGAGIDGNLYNTVIAMLSQKRSFDVLSAPSLRVRTGEDAKINVSRTFFYPTQFDPPETVQIQTTGGITVETADIPGPPTVIPAFPTEFESRDIGVKLTVKPQVGADRKTIDLALFPEVTDFEGFINYGDPIFIVDESGNSLLMTNNVINQPVFNTRRVNTRVFVKDGYTVVLGGLVRDDVQTINDKVPFLGDLPVVGRFFQSEASQTKKTNLLIFVTCQIYLNNGELLNPPQDPAVANAALPPQG